MWRTLSIGVLCALAWGAQADKQAAAPKVLAKGEGLAVWVVRESDGEKLVVADDSGKVQAVVRLELAYGKKRALIRPFLDRPELVEIVVESKFSNGMRESDMARHVIVRRSPIAYACAWMGHSMQAVESGGTETNVHIEIVGTAPLVVEVVYTKNGIRWSPARGRSVQEMHRWEIPPAGPCRELTPTP